MTDTRPKKRYTMKGYITVSIPSESYFLARDVYEAERMARRAGLKHAQAIKIEMIEEGTDHAL